MVVRMKHPAVAHVTFRLSAPALAVRVDVDLRSLGERWVAAAEFQGRRELGIGLTPRQALTAALGPLGSRATAALLADPALMAPSAEILRVVGDAGA